MSEVVMNATANSLMGITKTEAARLCEYGKENNITWDLFHSDYKALCDGRGSYDLCL